MKVLFVYPRCQPTDGGAFPVIQGVVEALQKIETQHQFLFVEYPNVLPKADFTWFLSPHYSQVDSPFAMTVWDLGHRELPEFPEVSVSGWTFDQREKFYAHVLPRAAMVSIGSMGGREQLHDFYRVSLSRIICNPLPVSQMLLNAEAIEFDCQKPFLLYPAQFWPHKNHITLVDALNVLRGRGRDFSLIFTGADKGNRAYVEQYARGSDVQFLGFVELGILKGLYQKARATVFASLMGPDNLPPLEAVALGCPLVLAALLEDPLDPQEWADAILRAEPIKSDVPTAEGYARKIVKALDRFAPLRKLWREYRHT